MGSDMSAAIDTLSTAHNLEAAGFERVQAEAVASAIGRAGDHAATKADLEPLATKAELSEVETRLTTRFYGAAVAIAGVVIANAKLL